MTWRLSAAEARARFGDAVGAKPKPKYNAIGGTLDGRSFDSKAELARYAYLKQVEMTGAIRELEVHPRFNLHAVDSEMTGLFLVGVYEADFRYRQESEEVVVEDVKGVVLPIYVLKRRLFLLNYPEVAFMEVRKCRNSWRSTKLTIASLPGLATLPPSSVRWSGLGVRSSGRSSRARS